MSEGAGSMSEGAGSMSEGVGSMSEGAGFMSEGAGSMSEGAVRHRFIVSSASSPHNGHQTNKGPPTRRWRRRRTSHCPHVIHQGCSKIPRRPCHVTRDRGMVTDPTSPLSREVGSHRRGPDPHWDPNGRGSDPHWDPNGRGSDPHWDPNGRGSDPHWDHPYRHLILTASPWITTPPNRPASLMSYTGMR